MPIRRPERARGPLSAQLRAALYYARKRRLARLQGGSTPVVTTFRYWRVLCEAASNASFTGMADLQMRETSGGADITTTGFAIAGGQFSTNAPENAFDGDLTLTFWNVDKLPLENAWIGQDFGAGNEKEIVEIAIGARVTSVNFNQTPTQFSVQRSADGVTWTTEWQVTGEPAWSSGEVRVFTKP